MAGPEFTGRKITAQLLQFNLQRPCRQGQSRTGRPKRQMGRANAPGFDKHVLEAGPVQRQLHQGVHQHMPAADQADNEQQGQQQEGPEA